jgi:hypothetical protein
MKSFVGLGGAVALGCLAVESAARAVGYSSPTEWIKPYKREALQDIVSFKGEKKRKENRECRKSSFQVKEEN